QRKYGTTVDTNSSCFNRRQRSLGMSLYLRNRGDSVGGRNAGIRRQLNVDRRDHKTGVQKINHDQHIERSEVLVTICIDIYRRQRAIVKGRRHLTRAESVDVVHKQKNVERFNEAIVVHVDIEQWVLP